MRRAWLLFSQTVTVAVALLFVVATLKPQWLDAARRAPAVAGALPPAAPPTGASAAVPLAAPAPPVTGVLPVHGAAHASYAEAAKRASPAVVSITASKTAARNQGADDPMLRFFFGDRARRQQNERQVGIGSGVIVSSAGYLLTNNHVVEGADEIEVALGDGRSASARVIGTDPDTDLAVLRITLDKLPVMAFGDLGRVQVGDVVLAIGNPFGVGQTVTAGIVSALDRDSLGINLFENFIQTDAAINPGNSGGALVDANGNLVGINTAIYSRTGGSMGIGFAIPVSTAKQVLDGLVKDGQVTRGWIGIEPRDLTPEFAKTLDLPVKEGVLVTGVVQNGPASQSGVRPGDVVVRVGDTPVKTAVQLMNAVAALKPRESSALRIQRGDRALDIAVVVAQRPRARPVR